MRAQEFIMTENKDLASFLAQKSPVVTLPADSARAQIFSSADRAAVERLVPTVRGQTDHEALQAGKELLEKFLNRIKAGETLPRQDLRVTQGLYDIIRRHTDRYDSFMRQHGLDE
jgi:hypothetical protein